MRHTKNTRVLEACETVASLCEDIASGKPRDDAAFRAVIASALAAGSAWSTRSEAGSARAAMASMMAAGSASMSASLAAAETRLAAWAAEEVVAFPDVTAQAAADRITIEIFDLIEGES